MKRTIPLPKLHHHKAKDLAYVRVAGRMFYFGKWGSPESQTRYTVWLAEYSASCGRSVASPRQQLTIAELSAHYLRYCDGYYKQPDGKRSSSLYTVESALRVPNALYASERANDFGPRKLKTVRDAWVKHGLCRNSCNKFTNIIRGMFKWAASEELIEASTWHALQTVSGLRRGRTPAHDPEPVKPVEPAHIEAVRAIVPGPVRALIELQLLTGARPGELVGLRAQDIDRSEEIWVAVLSEHKTSYRDKERKLYFGERAQAILRRFMISRTPDAPLFSPLEAEQERHAKCKTHRRYPSAPPRTERRIGDQYTVSSYRRAIDYACIEAGIPKWSPHRLRHTFATRVRAEFGLEAVQPLLGHSELETTQVYAEVNHQRAISVIAKIG